MKTKKTHWGVLTLIALIALLLGAYLPPLPSRKARPQRIQQGVNNIAPVFIMKQSPSPQPAAPTKK